MIFKVETEKSDFCGKVGFLVIKFKGNIEEGRTLYPTVAAPSSFGYIFIITV